MDDSTAQDRVKRKLYIGTSNTDFDTEIDQFVDEAVDELWPILQEELAPDTSTSLAAEENEFDLPDGCEGVRWLEASDSQATYLKIPTSDYTVHAGKVYLDEPFAENKTIKVFGLGRYAQADVPAEFCETVICWATSKFYHFLAGNKRKYNIYMQTTGRSGTDNMIDLADYFRDIGNQHLMDRVSLIGQN